MVYTCMEIISMTFNIDVLGSFRSRQILGQNEFNTISEIHSSNLKAHNAFTFFILINKLSYLITYSDILSCIVDQAYLI